MLLPSLRTGYARSARESEYPHLWQNLSLAWVFGMQPASTRIYDFSDNGIFGTFVGTVGWGPGKYGRAPIFNSTHVLATRNPSGLQIGTTDFSVCMWFRATVADVNQRLYDHSQTTGGLIVIVRTSTGIQATFDSGPAVFSTILTDTVVVDDAKWWHYAVVFDRDGFAYSYLNGKRSGAPIDISATASDNPTNTAFLSVPSSTAPLAGQMDDVRVYKRALSASDVAEIYAIPYAPWVERRFVYGLAVPGGDTPPTVEDQVGETDYETPLVANILTDATAGTNAIDPATLDLDPSTGGRQITFEDVGKGTYDIDDLGNLTFTPDAGFSGVSTASFTVEDTLANVSNTATITMTVLEEVGASTDFEGSPASTDLYDLQDDVFKGFKNDIEQMLRVLPFSYTHTKGAGTGEINIVTLPGGRIRVYPHLSTIAVSQFGASAVLSIGHRAYTTHLGEAVPGDDIEFMDGINVASGATPETFWSQLDSTAAFEEMEYDTVKGFTIYATVESGNIENGDTLDGIIVWARV